MSKPHLFAYTDKHINIKKVLANSVGARQHRGGGIFHNSLFLYILIIFKKKTINVHFFFTKMKKKVAKNPNFAKKRKNDLKTERKMQKKDKKGANLNEFVIIVSHHQQRIITTKESNHASGRKNRP